MIFLRYENFKDYLRLYPITSILLLINIVMFIILTIDGGSTNVETLLKYGAMTNIPYFTEGYMLYVRFVAAMFLHIGFQHLLFNCFSLFVFAPPLERLLGKGRYLLFYLGSGFVGNVLSYMLHSEPYYGAGASGSIYGVFAAFLYLILFKKHALDEKSKKTVQIILVIGIIYSVLVPGVSFLGHFGGFAGGFILFHLMIHRMQRLS